MLSRNDVVERRKSQATAPFSLSSDFQSSLIKTHLDFIVLLKSQRAIDFPTKRTSRFGVRCMMNEKSRKLMLFDTANDHGQTHRSE